MLVWDLVMRWRAVPFIRAFPYRSLDIMNIRGLQAELIASHPRLSVLSSSAKAESPRRYSGVPWQESMKLERKFHFFREQRRNVFW